MTEIFDKAVSYIKGKTSIEPKVGIVLGSGLGRFADAISADVKIPYEDIPGFPASTVAGHKGVMIIGTLHDVPVMVMQGRFHCYEGYGAVETAIPVRVMKLLGVDTLVVTNAAGGVNSGFNAGDLMIITDHINMSGSNPLCGSNMDEFGPRFPDMTQCYDKELIEKMRQAGEKAGVRLREGVYCMMQGPSYETPAEIRMIRTIGGDAVGMSSVPEVIAARHADMRVVAVSLISNMAAGMKDTSLIHEEVLAMAQNSAESFIAVLNEFLRIFYL